MERQGHGWIVPAAISLLFAVQADAQAIHLSVDPDRPLPPGEVHVQLLGGQPFADRVPPSGTSATQLEQLWHRGRAFLEVEDGTATFRAGEPGVHLLATRPPEAISAKALVVVGEPLHHETIWRSELGHPLEIVPRTDPVALALGPGDLEIQVLFRREPLAGATVVAVAEGSSGRAYRSTVTDGRGDASFDLDRPGRWLVHLAHKGRDGERGWALFQSSLVLTVGP
jgi:hypothetical protein